jgi:hypothetical protein
MRSLEQICQVIEVSTKQAHELPSIKETLKSGKKSEGGLSFWDYVFAIDGFLCWAIINADCLGCSFCGAVILLGGAEGGCSLETPLT